MGNVTFNVKVPVVQPPDVVILVDDETSNSANHVATFDGKTIKLTDIAAPPPPPPPTITGVVVSGVSALSANATSQFTAKVSGTGSFDTSVKWSCSDGSISVTGLFTAPANAENVTVTATSTQDSTKNGVSVCAISLPTNTIQIQASGGNDTAAVQTAMNNAAAQAKILQMTTKGGKFQVGPLRLPANLKLLVDPQVLISDIPGYGSNDIMFNPAGANTSFSAVGAFAEMPNSFAASQKDGSEYRHCFLMNNAGTKLIGLSISQAGGDGVYIRGCSNAVIDGVTTHGVFRNGMSLTGQVNGLTINNSATLDGLRAGFDFEPNGPGDFIQNVVFNNFKTARNRGGGLSIGLFNLTSVTLPVSVTINGFSSDTDEGYGFAFFNTSDAPPSNPSGLVTVNNAVVKNSGFGGIYGRRSVGGWRIIFNNPVVSGANRNGNDSHYAMNSSIGCGITGGQTGVPGGVDFNNVSITGGNGCMTVSGCQDTKVTGVCNGKTISYP